MRAPIVALWLLISPALAQEGSGAPGPSPPSPGRPSPESEIGEAPPPAPAPPSAPPPSSGQTRPVVEPPLDAPPLPVGAPPPSVPPPGMQPSSVMPPPVPLSSSPDPTRHRHLGFYVHADLGGGFLRSSQSPPGPAPPFSGGGVPLSFAMGFAFSEDWIAAGDIWVCAAPASQFGPDATLGLTGLGVGITRYFMPANVFVSLSPSLTVLSILDQNSDEVGRTEYGFGAKLAVGKEWWISDHWGIGLAAQFFFGINKDRGTDPPTWTSLGGGLVFSATYN